jgi:hypothetical protein
MEKRVALFALGLGAAFALAFAVGSAFDPADTEAGPGHGMERGEMGGHDEPASHGEEEMGAGAHGEHQEEPTAAAGLAVSEGGYTLRLDQAAFETGEAGELRFRIEDAAGATVREFDRTHERDLHLIVVGRDGTGFQHLHPEMDAAGTWATPLTLPAAGAFRVFADFAVDGDSHTLATDLAAPGRFEPRPFPAPASTAAVDGYELRLESGPLRAGQPADLRFTVSRDGEEVAGLENYLGARGHLVALREGDLAFLHVHPDEGRAPGVIPYTAHFPTAGRYFLFLQFKVGGKVHTAELTLAVAR